MVKSKSKIITIILSVILLACSFLLFGCDKRETTEQIQKSLNSFIQTENGTGSFLGSDNTFNDFKVYDDQYQLENIDNYQYLVSIAVDYIEQYSSKFESEQNFDYSAISQSLETLNKSFEQTLHEYQRMLEVYTSQPMTFSGPAKRYQSSAIDFINAAFQTALSIKDNLAQNFGLLDADFEKEVTVDQANAYLDAIRLEMANSYRQFLLGSCKGEAFEENGFYAAVSTQLQSLQSVNDTLLTADKEEKYVELKKMFDAIKSEQPIIEKALANFSFYDFVTIYDGNIAAYQTVLQDAENYLQKIESYFYNAQNQGAIGCLISKITELYS